MELHALLKYRTLFLSVLISKTATNQLASSLLLLDGGNRQEPIDFYINSGSLIDSMAIINSMQCIQVRGQADSATAGTFFRFWIRTTP